MAYEEIITIEKLEEYRIGYRPPFIPNIHGKTVNDLLFAPLLAGTIVSNGCGDIILPQQLSHYYFRGQNREYGDWHSSISRTPNIDDNFDTETRKFYRELQLDEFGLLIEKLPRVREWNKRGLMVNYEAIAQHYGLYTTMLDITNNFDVAIFFACCKYDRNSNKYRPLQSNDILQSDDQYGVIYRTETFLNCIKSGIPITPIGYQPFMRPQNQCGYIMCLSDDYNKSDFGFESKMKFKQSTEYSKKIFDEFDGGEKLFSKKDVNIIEDEILKIRDAKTFSYEAFESTCSRLEIKSEDKDKIKTALSNNKIELGHEPYNISNEQLIKLDTKWNFEKFVKQCGISPRLLKFE